MKRYLARFMNETNPEILEEAEILFGQNGVSNTTIHELARVSNMRVEGIYHYFSNKDEILFDILERKFREQLSQLEPNPSGLSNAVAKLEKYIWTNSHNPQSDKNLSRPTLSEFRHRNELTKNSVYHHLRKDGAPGYSHSAGICAVAARRRYPWFSYHIFKHSQSSLASRTWQSAPYRATDLRRVEDETGLSSSR